VLLYLDLLEDLELRNQQTLLLLSLLLALGLLLMLLVLSYFYRQAIDLELLL